MNFFILLFLMLSIKLSLENEPHLRTSAKRSKKFKNVVLIIADDLGWSDIGYSDEDEDLKPFTPNIDRLAANGIVLNNFYTYALCTPSRASVMTGVFVERSGLQHSVLEPPVPTGLPEKFKLMPHYFKSFGYKTHLVGKWHLGACNLKYTPAYRGFDTFYGFFGALNDYLTHRMDYNVNGKNFSGLDFWNQTVDYLEPVTDNNNTNSQIIFTERARTILEQHNKSVPFFLYFAAQTPHTDPKFNVPKEYIKKYSHIKDIKRRKMLGMISLLDDSIGNLTDTLEEKGLLHDTLIFFMSDNGGELRDSGRNYPFRGGKRTVFEGGHRVRSFVYDGSETIEPFFYEGMFHSVDWLPTILSAATHKPIEFDDIDGKNMWNEITKNLTSRRDSFIYSIDPIGNLGCRNSTEAIREGDWKFIKGCPGMYTDWYNLTHFNMSSYHNYHGELLALTDDIDYDSNCLRADSNATSSYFLFNIKDDPTETTNLASSDPCKLKELELKLEEYKKNTVPPLVTNPPFFDSGSDPANFNDSWMPGWYFRNVVNAQVVNADTSRVGCGAAEISTANGLATYVACNYAVANYFHQVGKPYTNGTSCSMCPGKCVNNLCECKKYCYNDGKLDLKTCTCTCPAWTTGQECETKLCDKTDEQYGCWSFVINDPSYCVYGNVWPRCPHTCGKCARAPIA